VNDSGEITGLGTDGGSLANYLLTPQVGRRR
jgi:hypothetical protein